MSVPDNKAVFLSYASQDTAAAQQICEALRANGVEVWFDQNELVGGDAWDAKIRKQIAECALFVPIISANTQARREGYFRLEWRLAAQRTHMMSESVAFLLPVVIDATRDAEADVPGEFRAVQWTRLPGGAGLEKFGARVQSLINGGTQIRTATPGKSPVTPAVATKARARWFAPAVAGLVLVIAIGVWLGRRAPSLPPNGKTDAPATVTTAKTATAPLSEAQKLVAQARQIYESGDEISRENLYYADELVQRALTLDPAEPSAWEFGAWISYFLVWHGFDDSEARRETMMRRVARAKALLPDSIPVRICELTARLSSIFVGARQRALDQTDIERELLNLLERDPGNWLGRRALGICYRLMNRPDEAVREFRRAIELSGGKPMAVGDLLNLCIRVDRFDEAERVLAEALPRQATGRLLTFDSIVRTRWRGDTAGALRTIETWPSWFVREDRAIALAWQAAMWARNPQRALAAVVQARADYVRDVNFSGPRAVLSARAHELAGNTEAALTDWRVVLQRCEQDFAANPQDIPALCWKSWALARMGDRPGAQAAATLVRQRADSAASAYFSVMSRAQLWATVGWTDLAIEELGREKVALDRYTMTRAYLELEPAFDPIREDPRFKALLRSVSAPSTTSQGAAAANSVAVLAFANMSADKENTEYFSDGVSEEILNALDRIPSLQVIPRTSSFSFKGRNVPLDEIGRTLRVASVIEGSVRKAGNEVRITVKLINATSGARVWVEEFTREMTPANIFAVQSEIAAMVARKLSGTATAPAAVAAAAVGTQTKNSAAYDAYLRARALQTSGLSAENGREMVRLFEEAVQLDPNYALAWAGLAQARVRMRSGGRDRSDQNAERARQAAMTALRLAPALPEAHVAMARVHFYIGYDLDAAQRAIDEVERLRPNDAEVPAFRVTLAQARGIWGEELSRLVARAVESDPQNADRIYLLGQALMFIGQFAAAEQLYERARAISPTDSQYRRLAQNYLAWTGDTARASAIYDLAGSGSPVFQSDRAQLRTSHGDLAGAIAQFERVIAATEAGSTTRSEAAFRAALLERRRNNSARAQELLDLALVATKEALRALPNDYYATALLPCIHAARGEMADARAALADFERLALERNSANPVAAGAVSAAEALALMGEADAAIAKLRALHEKGCGFGYTLRLDPEWEPLRSHPKFQQLMKEAEARADAQPRPKR